MRKRLFTKKFSKENLAKFFDKEGFYVVVFLCVAIIATTAVYITRNNMEYFSQGDKNEIVDNSEDHEYYQPEDIDTDMQEDKEQAVSANEGDEEELENPEEETATENEKKVEKQIINKEMIPDNATAVMSTNTQSSTDSNGESAESILNKLVNPVELASITMDFSYQSLPVFSITLDEFRSDHQGVDIGAEKGTIVKAAMDGKVIDIVQDPRLGKLIIVDHGSGVMTKYGNLDNDVAVTKNQQVKCGDILGKVGNTAMFEIDDEPHVHFEVWSGDELVDPKNYISDLVVAK